MNSKLIINNVKLLMKHNRDTKITLASKIKYGESTVYSYLNGTRPITQEFLIALTKCYGVPVKKISKEKLTEDDVKKLYDFIDEEEYQKYGEWLFIVQNDASNSDEFNNAIECFNQLSSYEIPSKCMIKKCRESFYKSFKKDGVLEGAANTIMTILFEFILLCLSSEFTTSFALGTTKNIDVENEIEKRIPKESKEFINNTEELYNECLIALRDSSDMYDLYEYCLAIRFLCSFIDNGKTRKSNTIIGCELLMQYNELGNKYVRKYIDVLNTKNT